MTAPMRRRIDEARLALIFLTRMPAGQLREPIPSLAEARWAFPLVGLCVGGLGWAVQHGALSLGLAGLPAAYLALAAMALLTGGLHHDGLADFADGIGGGRDRDHCLEIMRDSRIGSYGVLALIFAMALMGGAIAAFPDGAPLILYLLIAVGSRMAMLVVLDLLPPARGDGLGNGASAHGVAAWSAGLAAIVVLGGVSGAVALPVLVTMTLSAFALARAAMRRIGGQTGDVLGAVQLTCAALGWLAASAWMSA